MTGIAVTGLGLVLPCGNSVEAMRASLSSGTPAFTDLPEDLGGGRGAACLDFSAAGLIPPLQLRRLDRCSRFAWVAAARAFEDAGLDAKAKGDRIAIAAATLSGGSEATETFLRPYFAKGPEGASPLVFPNCVANAPAGHVAVAFGLKGPSTTQLERETGAFAALDQAARWLRHGFCDAALVLGTDGLFPMLHTVCAAGGLLARHGDPHLGGHGFLPGEGAVALVLERTEEARERGARLRARLGALSCRAGGDRVAALTDAAAHAAPQAPDIWIGGANGHPRVDALERSLRGRHLDWPEPRHPKLLWGEFGGAGAQLLAAGLLEPASSALVTGSSSFGAQWALRWDEVGA